MSVQLIVYSQDLVGTTSSTTTTTGAGQEFINDGQNFNTLNSATSVEGVDDASVFGNGLHALVSNPPNIPHTWYRYRNVSADHAPTYQAYPTQSGGDVDFETLGTSSASYPGHENNWSAIYQRMTGLVIGEDYLIRVTNNCVLAEESRDVVRIAYDWPSVTFPYIALPTMAPPVGTPMFIECTPTIGPPCVLNGQDIVYQFTATHTEHIFYLSMAAELTTLTQATIRSVSVKSLGTTSTVQTTVFSSDISGQEILDLYEDESIPLTLSIDDFKDVATKTQSYSKAFNLPATKKNNKVFGSLYEVTKQAGTGTFGFNPYARTPMTLKENGLIVFEGFLRLIDIIDKDGEISYNVNLYSETVAFMDVLKDKTFYELNLCELDHDYDLASIQASQTGVLPLTNPLPVGTFAGANGGTTTDVLKYPLVDWAGSMRREATTREVNLGATDGNPSMGRLEDGFRPFIKLKYLVDNIFADAGFTYDSVFFDSTYFNKLFMDFNWGEERDGSAPNRNDFTNRKSNNANAVTYLYDSPSWRNCPVSLGDSAGPGGAGSVDLWNNSLYKLTADGNNLVVTGRYRIQVSNRPFAAPWWNVDSWTVRLRICVFNSNHSVLEVLDYEEFKDGDAICPGCSRAIEGTFDTVLNNGDYIQMEGQVLDSSATSDVYFSDTTHSYLWMNYNNNAVGVCSLLQAARGELAQWDFFKGLTTMFNLITLQDPVNPSNLLIEPYDDVFTVNPDIKTIDWTKKVDISDIKLKPLDLERRVVLQFEEDEEDYPFSVYKAAAAGYLYGSGIIDIDGFDVFQGDKEVVASPFAATIFKNLFDDIFDFYAPVIYGSNEEQTEFGSIKNLPRILYDTGVYTISTTTFFIPAQNGEPLSNETSYSLFSHTDVVPSASTDVDLSFSVVPYQLMIQQAVAPLQNLFTNYYFNYFSELYNTNVKTMNIKVLLTPEDIANFNFYDKILIKNREYRVDKLNYKPNDLSTVEFILIT
tara:strand:- start:3040 stop:5988 length:2949 start_codon:yes stop_codon:yes gene_type:complete